MHKNRFFLALALLYTSATLYSKEPFCEMKRVKLTGHTSEIDCSSCINLKKMVKKGDQYDLETITNKDDFKEICLYLEKVGLDEYICLSTFLSVLSTAVGISCKERTSFLLSLVFVMNTFKLAMDNASSTNGQHWIKTIKSQATIVLKKKDDGIWEAIFGSTSIPDNIATELAQEIIANHNQTEDIYTSPILEQLAKCCFK